MGNEEIIIRKDIFYIVRITLYLISILVMLFVIAIERGFDGHYHEYRLVGVCIFGVIFLPIYAIYCIATYKSKYVTINSKGVEDMTKLSRHNFISFSEILDINFNKREMILELKNNNFILIPELKIKDKQRNEILSIFNKSKNNI